MVDERKVLKIEKMKRAEEEIDGVVDKRDA